jgi:xanthine dehydrogenase accessory factor
MTGSCLPDAFDPHRPAARIVVAAVEGSAPRETGAAMWVSESETDGTIGGGRLEYEAIAHARAMLKDDRNASLWRRDFRSWPLGPSLGQCCGGAVRVLFELFGERERLAAKEITDAAASGGLIVHPIVSGPAPLVLQSRQQARGLHLPLARIVSDMLSGARPLQPVLVADNDGPYGVFIEPAKRSRVPLFVYGAGHVGRAIVKLAADLDFDIWWVDTYADRFPEFLPEGVNRVPAAQPEKIAAAAPAGAFHLVLTYSHALDLAICRTLLAAPAFGFLGLIGSQTKRTRFLRRLEASGIASQALTRLTCPIGIGNLRGKEPATIAVSVAAQLIAVREKLQDIEYDRQTGLDGKGKRISA